ncbi:hypothetical protein ACIPW5_37785 [Streptomyces sp. NPDC090077]|uniref:hypothetical protein n=1 Tax=Streptomyces sp. NPDC090077 TaxID=3365938 RepID=UPI00380EE2CE
MKSNLPAEQSSSAGQPERAKKRHCETWGELIQTQAAETKPARWKMYVGGEPVGILRLSIVDQTSSTCSFEPLEDWATVRDLFEVQNQAIQEGFPEDKGWATKEIRQRGVELHPLDEDSGAVITPFMIYVSGHEARFRP